MSLFHLQGAPQRAPFSDWCAQVERQLAKHPSFGPHVSLHGQAFVRSMYDVGYSPSRAADAFLEDL